jgi:hypothetical protein
MNKPETVTHRPMSNKNISKSSEYEKALWDYIATLESTNHALLNTVKECVKVMTAMKDIVLDPIGWQEMLDTIKAGEKVSLKKVLH